MAKTSKGKIGYLFSGDLSRALKFLSRKLGMRKIDILRLAFLEYCEKHFVFWEMKNGIRPK